MNIWHKRLIQFILKIVGVLTIVFVVALFLFYSFYWQKDTLVQYVPQNAVMYSSWRVDQNFFNNGIAKKINNDFKFTDSFIDQFNPYLRYNFAMVLLPNYENKLSFDYLFVISLKPNYENSPEIFTFIKEKGWTYEILNQDTYKQPVLIISNSQKVLDKVKSLSNFGETSLADQYWVSGELKKLNSDYLSKIYLNLGELAKNNDKIDDLSIKTFLTYLDSSDLGQMYFGLKQSQNKLVLETDTTGESLLSENKLLLSKLPADYKLSANFVFDKTSIEQFLANLSLEQAKSIEKYQKTHDFDLNNELLLFDSTLIQLVTYENKQFVVAFDISGEKEAKIDHIENLIKQYLANKLPVEKEKKLPDGSFVTQIVKDLANLQFNEEKIADVSFFSIEREDLGFYYYIYGNNFILANSRQKIVDLAKGINLVEINLGLACLDNKTPLVSENIIIDNQLLANIGLNNRYIEKLIANQLTDGNICLILE